MIMEKMPVNLEVKISRLTNWVVDSCCAQSMEELGVGRAFEISEALEHELGGDPNSTKFDVWHRVEQSMGTHTRRLRLPKLLNARRLNEVQTHEKSIEVLRATAEKVQDSILPKPVAKKVVEGMEKTATWCLQRIQELNDAQERREKAAKEDAKQEAETRRKAVENMAATAKKASADQMNTELSDADISEILDQFGEE